MIAEEYMKGKVMAGIRRIVLSGRKNLVFYQASPPRPSNKGRMKD
jgi:hypothetical protein